MVPSASMSAVVSAVSVVSGTGIFGWTTSVAAASSAGAWVRLW